MSSRNNLPRCGRHRHLAASEVPEPSSSYRGRAMDLYHIVPDIDMEPQNQDSPQDVDESSLKAKLEQVRAEFQIKEIHWQAHIKDLSDHLRDWIKHPENVTKQKDVVIEQNGTFLELHRMLQVKYFDLEAKCTALAPLSLSAAPSPPSAPNPDGWSAAQPCTVESECTACIPTLRTSCLCDPTKIGLMKRLRKCFRWLKGRFI